MRPIFSEPADAKTNRDLARRVREGDIEARQEMIERNLGLIGVFARYYYRKVGGLYGPFNYWDVFHEGIPGLMRAIDLYDPDGAASFSRFSRKFISGSIWNSVRHDRYLIRVPCYLQGSFEEIRQKYRNRGRFGSFDENFALSTLAKNIEPLDRFTPLVFDERYPSYDIRRLNECLRSLNEQSRNVIILRYIDGLGRPEIAKLLKLRGKYHVETIEKKALAKLRKLLIEIESPV